MERKSNLARQKPGDEEPETDQRAGLLFYTRFGRGTGQILAILIDFCFISYRILEKPIHPDGFFFLPCLQKTNRQEKTDRMERTDRAGR